MRAGTLLCLSAFSATWTGVFAAKRRLEEFSGIEIARDNAGISFGVDGDVQLQRTSASTLGITGDVGVSGDLSVSGELVLSEDSELALTIASLLETVADLQAQISANTADISSNAGEIAAAQDDISLLDAQLNDPNEEVTVYESEFALGVYDEWTFYNADIGTIECFEMPALGGTLAEDAYLQMYLDGLPLHSQLEVSFTYMAIDSWDGEEGSCSIDGTTVWSQYFDLDDSWTGEACGISGHSDNYAVASVLVDHFEQGATVNFGSTIDQDYTDESFAVAEITIKAQLDPAYTPVYASDFSSNGASGWQFFGGADATTSTCGDWTILGGYDVLAESGSVVKKISNLVEHTELVISFEFLKIDTWDDESAKLFVDNQLVWSQAMNGADGVASVCGGTQDENLVPITLTIPHDEDLVTLRFTSTLNQGATDESWGLKSLNVFAHSPAENVVYETNFADGPGDWVFDGADAEVTECGGNYVLGGLNVLGADTSLTLNLAHLTPHTSVTVELDFVKIDSWDNEDAYFYIDDELVWTRNIHGSEGEEMCGTDSGNWREQFIPLSFTFDHYAQDLELMVTTGLSSAASDESWGVANVRITTTMDDCTSILYASDFTTELTEGWDITGANIDNVTQCDGEYLLGGYDNFGKDTAATKVVDLPSDGAGVVVAFSFIKVDSWDNENAQLYANDLLVWEETLTASQGSQLCGNTNSNWHEDRIIRHIDLGWLTTDTVTLTWTTTLSSGATDESWGLTDVDVYAYDACDAEAYQSNFEQDEDAGWLFVDSDGGITECGDYTILGGYNTFANDDIAQKLVELPLHTSIQVDFTFVKIDSWDNEDAFMKLDHEVLWQETLSASAGAQVCGADNSNWNEDFIEESFTVDHFAPYAWLQFYSDLSSGGTDESWGLENVRVTTTMDDSYTPVYISKFQFEQLDGWTIDSIDDTSGVSFSECGDIAMLGGYQTFAKDTTASRTLEDLPDHTSVTIAWTWAKIDSWDSENFYLDLDGSNVYTSSDLSASTGDALCGKSNSGWDETFYSISVTVDHSADTMEMSFYTDLSSSGSDESWGLVGVNVFVQ